MQRRSSFAAEFTCAGLATCAEDWSARVVLGRAGGQRDSGRGRPQVARRLSVPRLFLEPAHDARKLGAHDDRGLQRGEPRHDKC